MINEVIKKGSEDIVTLGTADIEELLRIARKSKLNRARYVMHRTNQDAVQEMIIALTHQVYIKPHKHLNKMESFFIIEGNLSIVFFDDAGVCSACNSFDDRSDVDWDLRKKELQDLLEQYKNKDGN